MRRTPRQRMTSIIGILAIAALIGAALSVRVIAAQETTPDTATQQEVTATTDATETAGIDSATSGDTDIASETPAAMDEGNGDPDEGGAPTPGEDSTSEAEPSPSAQPELAPTAGPGDSDGQDQPTSSLFPSSSPEFATPAAEVPVEAATPPANSCQADETALPDVRVSGTGFGAPVFNGTSYSPVTTTIAITLELPGGATCLAPAWSIALAASAMQPEQDEMGLAGVITFHDVSGLTAPGMTALGLAPGTALATAQTVVIGTNETLDADHPSATFAITLTWSPPADATAGQYVSSITVNSSAGEGG